MELEFTINAWAAYAPGIATGAQWRDWAANPWLPQGEEPSVPLQGIAPLLRRRLGRNGRLAAQAAEDVHESAGIPVVMASRYGDAPRSLGLLAEHALGRGVSPTDFTLSVHNAIGAVYSIAHGDASNYTAISAGPASAGAGLVESIALLRSGAPEVILVCYDACLPTNHASFHDEPAASYAWAWRLALPATGEIAICLRCEPATDADATAPQALPLGLDALAFALSGSTDRVRTCQGSRWHWSRRHA
jgi:hypothetical protein